MSKTKGTVMILGITGQACSFLADIFIGAGYKVIGLKRRTSIISTQRVDHLYNNPNFKMEYYNLTDSYSLMKILNKYKPDYVVHGAAQSHVRVSFDVPEETVEVGALGTLKLFNMCKEIVPNARILNFVSSEMFGTNPEAPQNENTRLMPASPYAAAKVFSYHIARNYREAYKMPIFNFICFNMESERRGETFVTKKITQAAARIKLGLQNELCLGNLSAKRDWGYCPNYMQAGFRLLTENIEPDDFCVATGETHTVQEFLDETFALANLDPSEFVKTDSRLYRPQEVPLLLGDSTKLRKALNWEPKVKFKELVRIMYEYDLLEQAKINNIQPTKDLDFFKIIGG